MVANPLKATHKRVVSAGSALADVLAYADDDFITSRGYLKGARQTISAETLREFLDILTGGYTVVAGGSACNTVIGCANLGLSAAFAGVCGQDAFGDLLMESLVLNHVENRLRRAEMPTGACLSLITPDRERTMLTNLSASDLLTADDAPPEFFRNAGLAHFEAYMVFDQALTLGLLRRAKAAGCLVSLDLGSHTVVEACRDFIRGIVRDYVDVLLANETEAMAYAQTDNEGAALAVLSRDTRVAAMKLGARGSVIAVGDKRVEIEAARDVFREIVDSTGAGDLWAAGFLYGLVAGHELGICGQLGSLCGLEACCNLGAQLDTSIWPALIEKTNLILNYKQT